MGTSMGVPAGGQAMRYDFLDWLRVIAILVLLFFHTGMLFVGWGWHIENGQRIDALTLPMDIAHRLRMPLLFMIAGAGMWFALRRRSAAGLVRERSIRLLLPLLAGMLLIIPPQVYFERVFRGEWHGGYLDFMLERVFALEPYPEGDLSWHHLWFIAYLYVYALLLLPLMLWWKRRLPALRPGVWLYVLALPLGLNEALLRPIFPETHNLIADWFVFNHYLLLTAFGFLLATIPDSWDWLAMHRRRALVFALAVSIAALALIEIGVIERRTAADALLASLSTWSWLLVFFGYGRRFLSFDSVLLRWSREASYPVYILHQTVIIALGFYVIRLPWAPWTKYAAVLCGTLATCVLLYQLCIRRFVATRAIFGMKMLPRAAPAIEAPRAVV